jgi:hypothetical protein
MRVRKNVQRIALATAFAVAAAFSVYFFLNIYERENSSLKKQNQSLKTEITQITDKQKKFNYVVAKANIKNGETLDRTNVNVQEFKVPIQGAYSNLDELLGLVVIEDVPKGKPLTVKDFNIQALTFDAEPRLGYRAVMLTMPYNYYPSFLNQTSCVDIYNLESRMKAKNVNILSIKDNPQKQEKKIIVEIKEQDVMNFINAASKGEVVFVQKNHKEDEKYSFSMGVPIFSEEIAIAQAPSVPITKEQVEPTELPVKDEKTFDIVEMIEGSKKTKVMFERE